MRYKFIISLILVIFTSSPLYAGECVVSSGKELISKLNEIQQKNACLSDITEYREKYDDFRGNSLEFNVIRINKSFIFEEEPTAFKGNGKNPLIILADPNVEMSIKTSGAVSVSGESTVILDNIIFEVSRFEISSSKNVILNSKIKGPLVVSGSLNHILYTTVTNINGDGILIKGDSNILEAVDSSNNGVNGVTITGRKNIITDSTISGNAKDGIFVDSCDGKENCTDPKTALISRTEFKNNGSNAISIQRYPLVAPRDMISIDDLSAWKVNGKIETNNLADYPWKSLNFKALKVELFIKDGPYIAEFTSIDPVKRDFVFSIQKPIVINGKEYTNPEFAAVLVDTENLNSSAMVSTGSAGENDDLDGDGLKNDEEDANHNGIVDPGETDPRNPDTDGDGLTDGEEKLHIGRIKELIDKKFVFADLSKLDPLNPDSDGDCLFDGLEAGVVGKMEALDAIQSITGASSTSASLAVSPYCTAILKKHNILDVTSIYDSDGSTITDATSADTDNDGLKDGEEDWNFNGKVDKNADGSLLESDPNNPDSDGDTLPDGQEGDKNGDGKLDDNETSPLLKDTDGDGVADNVEIRMGMLPNLCDTDKDGLSDGIETGVVWTNHDKSECSGLTEAGTNYSKLSILSPTNQDSDGDGLKDGEEDANHNGWVDPTESDPTISDTDNDGISDYIEATLDIDNDGVRDVDISLLKNGKKCTPPENINDVDCDDVPNFRDLDSDSDGCTDQDEGLNDKNHDGIPDLWQQEVKSCTQSSSSSSGGSSGGSSGSSGSSASGSSSAAVPSAVQNITPEYLIENNKGGGSCSLLVDNENKERTNVPAFLVLVSIAFLAMLRKGAVLSQRR